MTKKNHASDNVVGTTSGLDSSANSSAAQRLRVLNHLRRNGSLSTIEARHRIDCLHPAARVMELRDRGHEILTVWTTEHTPEGRRHRIARYFLIKEASMVGVDGTSRRLINDEESE